MCGCMSMPILEESIVINEPAKSVFALSQDYALRLAWDPFIRKMQFLDGARESGRGVRVWVRAWTGLTMEVQFVSFHPPSSVAMKMVRGPWFFQRFAGTWLFQSKCEGQTKVTFRYSFALRPGWFRRLADPIVSCLFRRDIHARLHGIKQGAEESGLLRALNNSQKPQRGFLDS